MAISKSTPYVRYKKDFTSSLHLGTIHVESEYLDRTQKTTIESIHGMTWHNKVVNENKELNLLSNTQLELTELEKQYWNTGEKRVSVDEIHTLEEVEPNEDGTYTYTVNSMEGEYIEIYDGINNITSTSDGLDGQFEIVYDTTEEDVNGNIALDQVVSQYEITDSGVGTITGAKSTGLTLVNHITESSKEEVVAIEQQEGRHFTIENTVQGNIKSAILKGQTLVNIVPKFISDKWVRNGGGNVVIQKTNEYVQISPSRTGSSVIELRDVSMFKKDTVYTFIVNVLENTYSKVYFSDFSLNKNTQLQVGINKFTQIFNHTSPIIRIGYTGDVAAGSVLKIANIVAIEGDHTSKNIPCFESMLSVKMPVLKSTGKNLFDVNGEKELSCFYSARLNGERKEHNDVDTYTIKIKPNTEYFLTCEGIPSMSHITYWDENLSYIGGEPTYGDNIIRQITSPQGAKYMRLPIHKEGVLNIQIEEGSVATPYEPFKSNILTVNEEVELREIGDVKDELNLLTGELTQRIGEIDFNTLQFIGVKERETTVRFSFVYSFNKLNQVICNNYPVKPNVEWNTDTIGIENGYNDLSIAINKSELSEISHVGALNFINNKGIRVLGVLMTPNVKTVDLTIQNQDGGTIPHIQTQQGITHVSTSSNGLSPTVEMSCSYDTIIKPNTTYTIKLDRPIVSDTMYLQVDLGGTMMMLDADVNSFTIKTPSTLSHSQLRLSGTGNTVKEIVVLEGNRVNDKIEYFEGMKNVENPILIVSNCPYVFGKGGRK